MKAEKKSNHYIYKEKVEDGRKTQRQEKEITLRNEMKKEATCYRQSDEGGKQ